MCVCVYMHVCVRYDVHCQVQAVTAATVSAAAEEIQSAILPHYTHIALQSDILCVRMCVRVCVTCFHGTTSFQFNVGKVC